MCQPYYAIVLLQELGFNICFNINLNNQYSFQWNNQMAILMANQWNNHGF